MAASKNDKLMKVGLATATNLDANYTAGATSLTVVSTSGMPTDTGITVAIDTIDSAGVQVPGSYNEYVCTVASATGLANVEWADGSGDTNYNAGATTRVYIPVAKTRENRIVEWGVAEHNQDGTHSDITADTITATTGTFDSVVISGSATAEGWSPLGATPNTVTANGNRSYDLVFNGTDLTDTISEGMRVRSARTVAAPVQCTSLNGTTQYYSKTSPNKMTFTDDFVVSAWVKLSSYNGTSQAIASRFNGTSGWELVINSAGQVSCVGYNAGSANYKSVVSYQSIPLNKWLHIAVELDMNTATNTGTSNYVMIDGVDVPAQVSQGGTNPTSLVQAGNLEIGSRNGGTVPFGGKIAQVAIYSAKVTQATILASMNQGLIGTETSLASAYSFNNSITDLNTTTPNDLTANGSAVATNADSPFGNSGVSTTIDYGIVMAKSFSTNTTLTIQVPEGCTIPTSGGVSSVDYSTQAVPYGFPRDKGRWEVSTIQKTNSTALSVTTTVPANVNSFWLNVPIGAWQVKLRGSAQGNTNAGNAIELRGGLSKTTSTFETAHIAVATSGSNTYVLGSFASEVSTSLSAATIYYANLSVAGTGTLTAQVRGEVGSSYITADNAYL